MKRALGMMLSSIALLGATSVPFVQPSHRIIADPPAAAPSTSVLAIAVPPAAKPKPAAKPADRRVARPAASRSRRTVSTYRATRPQTSITAESGAEGTMVSWANNVRASAGCRSVSVYGGLPSYARNHSSSMAQSGTLYHSSEQQLYAACPSCQWVGEIVGAGPTLQSVQSSFVHSSSHYATMTNGNFRWIGSGVVYANGEYWVTEVYGG